MFSEKIVGKTVKRLQKTRGWKVQPSQDGGFTCNGLRFSNEPELFAWAQMVVSESGQIPVYASGELPMRIVEQEVSVTTA